MATKNEDQTKILENVKKNTYINQPKPNFF